MNATAVRKPQRHTIRVVFEDEEDQQLYRLLTESADRSHRHPLGWQVRFLLKILCGLRPDNLLSETGLMAWGLPRDVALYREVESLKRRILGPWTPSRPILRLVPTKDTEPDPSAG